MTLNLVKSRDSGNGAKLQYAIDLNAGIFTFIPDGTDEDQSEALRREYECANKGDVY